MYLTAWLTWTCTSVDYARVFLSDICLASVDVEAAAFVRSTGAMGEEQ